MTSKRIRSRSPSYSASASPEPTPKALRTTPLPPTAGANEAKSDLICTLPPTCNHRPTALENTKDLEAHYAMYHAHVCEIPGCHCVFPDARLLSLHQTECHDPLAAVRKDRGEKIFACHLASCPRLFLTPKARRLHLIDAHAYPQAYFFAVTNKGVGGLLRKWGEGASLIRGEWKPREEKRQGEPRDRDGEGDSDEEGEDASDEEMESEGQEVPPPNGVSLAQQRRRSTEDADMDALANNMTSLSLVPSAIRFGRGGRRGGGAVVGQHRAVVDDREPSRGEQQPKPMKQGERKGDGVANGHGQAPAVLGGGARGRGRAGIIHVNVAQRENAPAHASQRGRGRGRGGRGRGRPAPGM